MRGPGRGRRAGRRAPSPARRHGRHQPDARSTANRAARSATPARSAPATAVRHRHRHAEEAGRPARPCRPARGRPARASATRSSWPSTTSRRDRLRRAHSATHLLHAALRRHLGTHVAQKGSLVAPDRLRFDFSQPQADDAPTSSRAVEAEVNRFLRQNDEARVRDHGPRRGDRRRRHGAVRREVRRRGARRLDGRGRGRPHLLGRALRRHPCPAAPATSPCSASPARAPSPPASAGSRR